MTAMMTVTGQMTLMKLRISLDTGVRCIFDWNSCLSRKQYEI